LKEIENLLPHFQSEPEALSTFTISAIFYLLNSDHAEWQKWARALIILYNQYALSIDLGQALTTTLPNVNTSLISPAARQLWLETWQNAAGEIVEMRLPLRLLEAAIRYYDSGTPPDPRILLELPIEERSILEALLGVNEK
jgi:hypothetical protein